MPEYMFRATDRLGNTVVGTVHGADPPGAAEQVRRMGYTPVQVEPVASGAMSHAGHTATPATASTSSRPLVPLNGEWVEPPVSNRLEPWERGGPIPQPPAPPVSLNASGMPVVPASGAMPSMAAVQAPPVSRIPYGADQEIEKSLWQRFLEAMVYPIYSGVVIKDLASFYRQFATLIDAGLPLYQALVALEGNTHNPKLKEVARAGQQQVQAGGRFSDVMQAYRWAFSPMQIELVRAAEKAGTLDQTLRQIADYIEHELEIRQLIRRETFYPKLTLFIAVMILGAPGFSGALPAIAALVLGSMGRTTYSGVNYLWDTFGLMASAVVPLVLVVAVFRMFLFHKRGFREAYDMIKLSLPVLGGTVRQFALGRFARAFAALYRAGFSMCASLEIAGDACANAVMREAAYRAAHRAANGGSVADALGASGVFPPVALNLLRTGETSGNLDVLMDKMADFFEGEAKTRSHQAGIALGVLVFLAVALLVGQAVIGQYTGYATGVMRGAEGP